MDLLIALFILALFLGIFPAWYAWRHDLWEVTYPALILSILGIPVLGWLIGWWIVIEHMDREPAVSHSGAAQVPPSTFPLA